MTRFGVEKMLYFLPPKNRRQIVAEIVSSTTKGLPRTDQLAQLRTGCV